MSECDFVLGIIVGCITGSFLGYLLAHSDFSQRFFDQEIKIKVMEKFYEIALYNAKRKR